MKRLIGLWFILTALIFGAVEVFGMEAPLEDKVETVLVSDLFVTLMLVGLYLLGS